MSSVSALSSLLKILLSLTVKHNYLAWMLKSFRFGTENNQEDIKSEDKAHKFLILETLHNSLLSEKKHFLQ